MTGVPIVAGIIGSFLLSGYFMTKWENEVFPGNQDTQADNEEKSVK
ncbi:hypothetical protein HN020_16960 [Brevibacillus borstelensis]|nr:hypothetical protein [Brevibacillus borstelensis]NOU56404.1 hypothetical protein [Brevibacillus borstelensis]